MTGMSHENEQINNHRWVPHYTQSGQFPQGAVVGGKDSDGSDIYVGRAQYNGDVLPCKVIPARKYASVPWGSGENSVQSCEVLCQKRYAWVTAYNGKVPRGAVEAGKTSSGETLYVGRFNYSGSLTVGKIHPSHGCCYIPYGGKEIKCQQYEALVYK